MFLSTCTLRCALTATIKDNKSMCLYSIYLVLNICT